MKFLLPSKILDNYLFEAKSQLIRLGSSTPFPRYRLSIHQRSLTIAPTCELCSGLHLFPECQILSGLFSLEAV